MLSSKKALSSSWLKKGVIITITVSMISMILLFFKSTTTNTWRSLRAFRPETILILLGALFLSWLIEGLRIKLIIESLGESISLKEILRINMAALFSGNITPFTSGSVPTQVYLLHKKGAPVGKATAVVTIRIAFSNLFFAIGGPTILFFFRQQIFNELGIQHLSGIINYILFFALFLSALLLFLLFNPAKGEAVVCKFFDLKLTKKLLGAKAIAVRERVVKELEEFHSSLTLILRKNFFTMIGIICLSILYWVVFLSIAPLVMAGFGVSIKNKVFRLILLQFIVIFLISFFPIPGGSGLAEFGLYSVFSIYLPKHLLAVAVMIWRFLSYHINTLIGGFFFLRLLFKNSENEADLPE